MNTEIKLWEISNNRITAIQETDLASHHLEAELEDWIAASPDALGEDLLIIARQENIPGVGKLDLLAMDRSGELVVVELKRSMAPREAVAQALDYGSWLASVSEAQIMEIAQSHLKRPLDEVFLGRFNVAEMPPITPRNHRILLVAASLDASSERIINYLAQGNIRFNAIFFRYAKLAGGTEILARSMLVAESVTEGTGPRRKVTATDLINMAKVRQVGSMVEPFRALAKDEKYVGEQAALTYGGSFRFLRNDVHDKWRVAFGLNVSGERCHTPIGQLDVWTTIETLADVLGVGASQMEEMLKALPVLDMRAGDCIIRLKDQQAADRIAKQLQDWFERFPARPHGAV
jgi:hypothetical protein